MGTALSSWTILAVGSPVPPARVSLFLHLQTSRPSSAIPPSPPDPLASPTSPTPGSHPEFGCRLYLHLPRPQQEEVERLLEASGEADKGWQGLAGRLGYPADAVEVIARGQLPAHTLLRDWAVKEGSGATLRVLEDTLAAMGREDVLRVLGPPAEGCSVV